MLQVSKLSFFSFDNELRQKDGDDTAHIDTDTALMPDRGCTHTALKLDRHSTLTQRSGSRSWKRKRQKMHHFQTPTGGLRRRGSGSGSSKKITASINSAYHNHPFTFPSCSLLPLINFDLTFILSRTSLHFATLPHFPILYIPQPAPSLTRT